MDIDAPRYYTHFSIFLFLFALVIPKGFLKTALLLNSILVGVVGNLIVMNNFEFWSQYETPRKLLTGNFLFHTLPMFLSFIVLFCCPPENGMTSKYLIFLSAIFLLWSVVPVDGRSMSLKIFDSYRVSAGLLTLITAVLTISTCKSIEYIRNSSSS
jgi:uncharacterized membrane protein